LTVCDLFKLFPYFLGPISFGPALIIFKILKVFDVTPGERKINERTQI
jgi:hypothetical protein